MYVCLCNALRERECVDAARAPEVRNAKCVYKKLGCAVQCGSCVKTMQTIVRHTQKSSSSSASANQLKRVQAT